jgi:EAL domain-containing protein (putative c-di-GMP-specific phosphodiesterase class I)
MLQLADINFVATVFRIMKEEGIAPHELELEITESLAMVDPEKTRKVLYALQEIGVRILLDDFGSGYSSLNHLRQFPVYGLKIDNQFIQHAVRSKKDQNLMHSIVLLARTLDLDVVAEGVETEEQLELLKSMGCSFVQGYYFTQPLPAVEYREWCENFTERPI